MSKLSKIVKDNPEVEITEEITSIADQLDVLHDIKALGDTAGGQRLVKLLITDVRDGVLRLSSVYKTASLTDLQAIIAELDSKLSLARLIINAKDSKEILEQQLDEALRE